jgi:hypothetical protein
VFKQGRTDLRRQSPAGEVLHRPGASEGAFEVIQAILNILAGIGVLGVVAVAFAMLLAFPNIVGPIVLGTVVLALAHVIGQMVRGHEYSEHDR